MTFLVPSYTGERRARLASGLVLLGFLFCHCADLALGLVSVEAMEAARPWLMGPWHSAPGAIVLVAAFTIHFALALRALYRRRTLWMSGREAAQLAFGLVLPFLLVSHILSARVAPLLSGQETSFAKEVYVFWVASPAGGARQMLVLVLAWLHGLLGLWFWLRIRSWAPRAFVVLMPVAVLVPVLAALGFAEAGKQVADAPAPLFDMALMARMERLGLIVDAVLLACVLATLLARGLRFWLGRQGRIRIEYPDGRIARVPVGFSVLEASRTARVPHASFCGGRGRCSTCRIRLLRGALEQPAPGPAERATLARIGADPDIRLACQLRPTADLSVYPVLSNVLPRRSLAQPRIAESGVEREIAVLFCDLRGFTRRAEHMLPYDTVFLLNRYFHMVGEAVEASGGHLDKFIGDGALALFGLATPIDVASRAAIDAAMRIGRGIDAINLDLEGELDEPLRIAMGLHAGRAVVGEMGFGRATSLTAVGDCINVASRLETAAKAFGVEAVVSMATVRAAGLALKHERRAVEVKGRSRSVEAFLLPRVADVTDLRMES